MRPRFGQAEEAGVTSLHHSMVAGQRFRFPLIAGLPTATVPSEERQNAGLFWHALCHASPLRRGWRLWGRASSQEWLVDLTLGPPGLGNQGQVGLCLHPIKCSMQLLNWGYILKGQTGRTTGEGCRMGLGATDGDAGCRVGLGDVAQLVECLPNKCEALSLISSTTRNWVWCQ